jgi:L-cysteine S-thiosulfotransferase
MVKATDLNQAEKDKNCGFCSIIGASRVVNLNRGESMKSRSLYVVAGLLGLLLLGACRTYPNYVGDFRFPILRGDIERGQQSFVSLGCNLCHSVDGVNLARPANPPVTVPLGGELIFVKTYGDLVTSIINPDHVLSERYLEQLPRDERRNLTSSPMYVHPDMKVSELIDIVVFLNSRYNLLPGYVEYYY